MRILCVAATPFEIFPLVRFLSEKGTILKSGHYSFRSLDIQILTTGVGLMQTAYHLSKWLNSETFGLVLNLGVAGAFDRDLQIGEVLEVGSERVGDLGAESSGGHFLDLKDLELMAGSSIFDANGVMHNPGSQSFSFLKRVNGLSVNKVHGEAGSIRQIIQKYPDVQIESMEGAAVFYTCLHEKVPFLEVRSISNYVEPRNKDNWQLEKAIDHLNETAVQLIDAIA